MTPGEMAELARIVAAQVMSHLDETWNRPAAVSLEEAARLLSCSPKHIGRLVKSGELRLVTIGKLRRVPMTEVYRLTSVPHEASNARRARPQVVPASVQLKALRKAHPHLMPTSAQPGGER